VIVVLSLVRTIASYISGTLNSAQEDSMFLLSTMWHIWVYVCSMNSGDIASNIEVPVDKSFGFATTLNVPDIQPDNSHVRLWRYFNNEAIVMLLICGFS